MPGTMLQVEEDDTGWRATQENTDLVGRGPNPARAAANYCELVAETEYEEVDA